MLKNILKPDQIEIPFERSRFYRFFEIVPALMSIFSIALIFILSAIDSFYASIYVLAIIALTFVRGLAAIVNSWFGFVIMRKTAMVDWHQRLLDLERGEVFHHDKLEYGYQEHLQNVLNTSDASRPSLADIYHLIIIAAYNETAEVLEPTIHSLINTSSDKKKFIVCLAYEERGGPNMEAVAQQMLAKYKGDFYDFLAIKHPDGMADEVIGKGSNITYAGQEMKKYLKKKQIKSENVIVTTLDSDNRPHPMYFDCVSYQFIARPARQYLSFQPVALFLNNIWDTSAPIRVSSSGDSIWNTILTVRGHKIRNFASHSQPMLALEQMDFWSKRTVVEDGHQYWRSFFFFKGNYDVVPIRLPIYQDAVLSSSYRKTLTDRFVQVRRWAYGASDIPYVANMIKQNHRELPLAESIYKFFDLLDGHVTWASSTIVILLGGWIPSLFGKSGDIIVHQLPATISVIQTVAIVGIVSTVILFFRFLPMRPKRYSRSRNLFMLLQWVTFPVTAIIYGSLAAFYAQIRLMSGRYLTKFDVTNKNTVIKD